MTPLDELRIIAALQRFVNAQAGTYDQALAEVRAGRKRTHWMWYIFPQLAGLGHSPTAQFYGIADLDEATLYLDHLILGPRLILISQSLIALPTSDPREVMGHPDDLKLRSSMTIFAHVPDTHDIFQRVLHKFYGGLPDQVTLNLLTR